MACCEAVNAVNVLGIKEPPPPAVSSTYIVFVPSAFFEIPATLTLVFALPVVVAIAVAFVPED